MSIAGLTRAPIAGLRGGKYCDGAQLLQPLTRPFGVVPIDTHTLLVFAAASVALILTPGPNMLYIVGRSVGQGRRAGVVSTFGVGTGLLVHLAAAVVGISAVIASSAAAFRIVRYAGAVYLVYLGVRHLLGEGERAERTTTDDPGTRTTFVRGIVTMVLNPKMAVFFLAYFPQFVRPATGNATTQMLILGAVYLLLEVGIYLGIALVTGRAGEWLRAETRFWKAQRWVTGGTFLALGAATALGGPNRR